MKDSGRDRWLANMVKSAANARKRRDYAPVAAANAEVAAASEAYAEARAFDWRAEHLAPHQTRLDAAHAAAKLALAHYMASKKEAT